MSVISPKTFFSKIKTPTCPLLVARNHVARSIQYSPSESLYNIPPVSEDPDEEELTPDDSFSRSYTYNRLPSQRYHEELTLTYFQEQQAILHNILDKQTDIGKRLSTLEDQMKEVKGFQEDSFSSSSGAPRKRRITRKLKVKIH